MDRGDRRTEILWDKLNAYVEAIHAKGSQGFSVFDAVALVAHGEPPFDISFASKDAHDEESYKRLAKLAADLGRTHKVVGTGAPLLLVGREEFSFRWQGNSSKPSSLSERRSTS